MNAKMDRKQKVHDIKTSLILNAALTVFAEKGLNNATVEDIGCAAGFSKPSLYNYFKSKETIFTALTERELSRCMRKLTVKIDATHGFFVVIKSVVLNIVEECVTKKKFRRFFIEAYLFSIYHRCTSSERAMALSSPYGAFVSFIGNIIDQSIRNHEIPKRISRESALNFCTIVIAGYAIQSSAVNELNATEQAADEISRFICGGLGVASTPENVR
jgi:AcrR family transcriptional regulator